MVGRVSEDQAAVAPKWPFAYVALDTRTRTVPAIVLEWNFRKDSMGMMCWFARCLYWDEGEAKVGVFPGGIAGVVSKARPPRA